MIPDDEQAKAFSEHWNERERWLHPMPKGEDELYEMLADAFVSGWEAGAAYEYSNH